MASIDLEAPDLRAVLEFASVAHSTGWTGAAVEAGTEPILEGLMGLVDCDFVTLTFMAADASASWVNTAPSACISPGLFEAYTRHADQHPYVRYHRDAGLSGVHRTSDLLECDLNWRSGALYTQHFKPLSVHHQLCSLLTVHREALVGLAFNRSGPDFSDRDCEVLDLAQVHVSLTFENHQRQVEMKRRIALLSPGVTHLTTEQNERLMTLTDREREVAALLRLGHANKQIARRLLISERTVNKHVEHILAKLKVPNRTAVASLLAQFDASEGP